jgi:hypothetical protein
MSACFGTTKPDPASVAQTQLVLSKLGSLVPPSSSTSIPSSPGIEQTSVNQFSCQVQEGGSPTAQTQSASQTSATVQILPALLQSAPADAGSSEAVSQTEQQIWQLQIGCLSYCVDTQQIQEAEQSTTVVVTVVDPAASSGTAPTAIVQQTIWQLQIGCLAWCWNATQAQSASTQEATPVATGPPPDGRPSGGGPSPTPTPTPGAGPAPPAPAPRVVRLLASPHAIGLAILDTRSLGSAVAPANRFAQHEVTIAAPPVSRVRRAIASVTRRPRPRRPSIHAPSSPQPPRAMRSRLGAVSGAREWPAMILLLTLAGVVSLAAVVRGGRR